MMKDARELPPGSQIEADLCIIGAGPAGLAMALRLDGAPFRVAVLESGGLGPEGSLGRVVCNRQHVQVRG